MDMVEDVLVIVGNILVALVGIWYVCDVGGMVMNMVVVVVWYLLVDAG